ncbi:hypothetical protein LXL04_005014 [Taraxacum kok-saghyz]
MNQESCHVYIKNAYLPRPPLPSRTSLLMLNLRRGPPVAAPTDLGFSFAYSVLSFSESRTALESDREMAVAQGLVAADLHARMKKDECGSDICDLTIKTAKSKINNYDLDVSFFKKSKNKKIAIDALPLQVWCPNPFSKIAAN